MTLWDLIRDFFVMHVFGGISNDGSYYYSKLGNLMNNQGNFGENANFNDLYFSIGNACFDGGDLTAYGQELYISASDWLSTTATMISITIIVVLCCMFVYKIIKLIGGLIR